VHSPFHPFSARTAGLGIRIFFATVLHDYNGGPFLSHSIIILPFLDCVNRYVNMMKSCFVLDQCVPERKVLHVPFIGQNASIGWCVLRSMRHCDVSRPFLDRLTLFFCWDRLGRTAERRSRAYVLKYIYDKYVVHRPVTHRPRETFHSGTRRSGDTIDASILLYFHSFSSYILTF